MKFGWQEVATAAVVLSAAAWLVRRAVRANRKRVVCAHCPVPKLPVRPSVVGAARRGAGKSSRNG